MCIIHKYICIYEYTYNIHTIWKSCVHTHTNLINYFHLDDLRNGCIKIPDTSKYIKPLD